MTFPVAGAPGDHGGSCNGTVHSPGYGRMSVFHLRPSSCCSRVGSVPGIMTCAVSCLDCGVRVYVLNVVSVLVFQIKSKRHKRSSKTQKAHRKVREQ